MSEKEKRCGSCKHWNVIEEGESNPCGHTMTQRIAETPLPHAIKVVYMYPTDGTDCPCREPREEK